MIYLNVLSLAIEIIVFFKLNQIEKELEVIGRVIFSWE